MHAIYAWALIRFEKHWLKVGMVLVMFKKEKGWLSHLSEHFIFFYAEGVVLNQ